MLGASAASKSERGLVLRRRWRRVGQGSWGRWGWSKCRVCQSAAASAAHGQMLKIIEVVSLTSVGREIRLKGMQFLTRERSMGPSGKSQSVSVPATRRLSTLALLALVVAGTGAGAHDAFAQDPGAAPPPSQDGKA